MKLSCGLSTAEKKRRADRKNQKRRYKIARKERWHRWFAWFPVTVQDREDDTKMTCAWMETVERRGEFVDNLLGDYWLWTYREVQK